MTSAARPPKVVTLRNPQGHALHCMLHEPPAGTPKRDIACLLLSPGVKMRVAPHRLYRKIQDSFLSRGIPVMRVDFHGLGDSEGELPEKSLDQLYRQVQLGRHVPDAIAGMDFFEREYKVRRFIVGGLCGGALTGLLTAEADKRVAALYALGIPVILDGHGAHVAVNMTQGQLSNMRMRYFQKLTSPAAWKKLLSFKTDFKLMKASLLGRKAGGGARKGPDMTLGSVPAPKVPLAANLNPGFPRAFFKILGRGAPALLLFSGADRLQHEYQEKFVTPWADEVAKFSSHITHDVIPAANHILSEPEWIASARRHTEAWLDRRFPAAG